jgi:hypothetical protein
MVGLLGGGGTNHCNLAITVIKDGSPDLNCNYKITHSINKSAAVDFSYPERGLSHISITINV